MILWGPVPLLRCLISSNVSTLNDNIFSSFLLISYMFVSEYQTVVICWFITGYSVHYVSHCSCTSLNMHNMIMLESSELFQFLLMWSTWRALWPPSGYAAIPVEKEKKRNFNSTYLNFVKCLNSSHFVSSASMAKLDEESEELHQKFLEKDIDLPTFVQKYKKLRTTYHKQALLHLAGQTSLRWHPSVVSLARQMIVATSLYTCSPILFLHCAWPCFWVQRACCKAWPNINRRLHV